MMTLADTWLPKAPPLREDPSGAIRVGSSRVTLDVLLECYQNGMSAEEIAEAFDTVRIGEVYAVISYYLENKPKVDQYLAEGRARAEELKKQIESRPGYLEWRDALKARMAEKRKQIEAADE